MKNVSICLKMLCVALVLSVGIVQAQDKKDSTFKPSGQLWGYAFGDYYVKAHSDSLGRGGSNQYTGIPGGGGKGTTQRDAFQLRRVYLGYNYDISKKFSAELLLAAEDNVTTTTTPSAAGATSGDELTNSKLTFYIKLINLRVKNVWKGTDFLVGQIATPAFPLLTEKIWGYRSVERTISDIRRTPSYDLGASLQGTFDPATKNYGYNLMVGNGTSAKPENDSYKWFYGDVYAKFLHQKVIVDLYGDYEKLDWTASGTGSWHHSRSMVKLFAAYTVPKITFGVEGFVNTLQQDMFATRTVGGKVDTLTDAAMGISVYAHGRIIGEKLGFFARYDAFNPNNRVDNNTYNKYVGHTGNYTKGDGVIAGSATDDATIKEQFVTVGLDYCPMKNVHFMPNIWYNDYQTQITGKTGKASNDYDLVYRLTFYYTFGK